MKDYIKPTFTLAGLFPVAMAVANCGIDEAGKALLESMIDGNDWTTALTGETNDGCTEIIDTGGMYCKFTAANFYENVTVVIGS